MTAAPATAQDVPSVRRRNEAIDVVRLIAAVGIVYVHAVHSPALDASRNFFRFAVPFYLCASIYFQSLSLRTNPDIRLLPYVIGRARRLYLPFLGWSVIYLVARDVRYVFSLHVGAVKLEPGLLWRGTEYHLWFLPFLLAASILLAVIYWTTLRRDHRWRWPLILLALVGGFVFAYTPMPAWNQNLDNPAYGYVQNWRAMPALCWAFGFAWFMTMGPIVYSVSMAMGAAGAILAPVCSLRQVAHGILLAPRALTGVGCLMAALAPWRGRWIPPLAHLGRYSYGIYLCHVLICESVRAASTRNKPDSVAVDVFIFLSSLLGSFVVVLALGSSRRTAWLNG